MRTEAAAHLLDGTDLPLPAVAARVGLGSTETLRQAFIARYAVTPSAYRATRRRARDGSPRRTRRSSGVPNRALQ